jgi:hypothetical protein
MQRSDDGAAFVSRVDSVMPEEFTPACGKLARCIRDAWLDREAELPDGTNSLVLEEDVYLPLADVISPETTDAEWAKLHDHRVTEQLEDNRQRHEYFEKHKREHSPEWQESMIHNLTMGEMRTEDARQMTMWLRGERSSCEGYE